MNQPSSSHRTGSRLFRLAHSICALVFASLGASALAADSFTIDLLSGNADSGVDMGRTYRAIGNIVVGNVTVNGSTFIGTSTSGTGWSLADAGNQFGEGNLTGLHTGYDQLVDDFYYGGNPGVLTFKNLTIGQTYNAALYTKAGLWGGRQQTATFDEDGAGPASSQVTFDPGNYGYQSCQFVALSSSLSISMAPANAGNTYHWFAATLHESAFAAATLTVGDANNYAFSGVITGATNFVKQGAGTQPLSGANTYTGFTAINNGVLSISASSNLGDGSATNTTVNLGGWSFTDDEPLPGKWVFPARRLAPGGCLSVFLSGKNRAPASGNVPRISNSSSSAARSGSTTAT